MKKLSLCLCLIVSTFILSAQQITVIHAGNLMAVPGQGFAPKQTVIIKDGKIEKVSSGFLSPKQMGFSPDSIHTVNLRNSYVLPGFIDMHTHITQERNPARNRHEWTTLFDEDAAFEAIPYMERTLQAGFTTVRNLGANYKLILALKRAVDKGIIAGPRIIASTGAISATGGHGDRHGYRPEILHAFESSVGICDGSADCQRAVRAMVKQGAEVIKITATGGVLSNTSAGVGQQLTSEELEAIVKTAGSLGRKVAAHAHQADGINAALRAGVNSIEHGSYLDDESVRLFNQTGAYLVPTLLAGVHLSEELDINPNIPPAIVAKIKQVVPVVEASFKRALKGGVKIAFGTDSGVSKHGTNAREFELMVKYGMDPEEAIKSATLHAADLLDMSAQIGSIEKGKSADVIAVDTNPLQDISSLKQVSFVMKGGKVFKE